MKANKLQRISNRIKKKAIQALLYISEDEFDITKSSFFNCLKIIVYFLQLEGYVFSQYESKPLTLKENIYFSNYTQLSAFTFILFQIGNDFLTQLFFYVIFFLHLIIYLLLAILSLDKQIEKSGITKKMLHLFFTNYQWIFVTPFQEISIGVMVCGDNAFIKQNQYSQDCQQTKNQFLYIFGSISTIFVFISGFSISYFFRNYQFNDKTFSRQFNYATILRILLHQIVIILYYIDINGIDFIKHAVSQTIGLTLILDIIFNQPFGYSFDSKFYSAATLNHQCLLILSTIWIFKSKQNDEFIFLAFLMFIPINTFVSNQFLRLKQLKIYNTFNPFAFQNKFDKQLEEIYRVAESSENNVESKLLLYLIFNNHITICQDIECLCMRDIQSFFINNSINSNKLNQWTTILFQKQLNFALINKDFDFYEHLSLKFVTFLAKYQNNPINAYSVLQKIMNSQKSQSQMSKSRRQTTVSFYFKNIQKILLRRNRKQFMNQQIHCSKKVESLLQGQAQIENIGQQMQEELLKLAMEKQKFWESYLNSKIASFQLLDQALNRVQQRIIQTTYIIKQLRNKIQHLINQKHDCVSILNFELLFKICTTNNAQEVYDIQQKIKSILLADQYEDESYLNIHFQTKECISLIANISQNKRGELWKPNQTVLQKFFQKNQEIKHLNDILPSFIADIHNGIIENYIRQGRSSRTNAVTQIFSNIGEEYIEPIQFTLKFFFPKFESDDDFYMIGFLRKEEEISESNQHEKKVSGYICFDQNLNILGINQVVAQKLNHKFQRFNNYNGLDICSLLPTILSSLIDQYKQILNGKIDNLIDNEMIIQKNQEVFYVPNEFQKNYYINPNDSLVDKIKKFEEIYAEIQEEQCQFLNSYHVDYQIYSKRLKYFNECTNNVQYKEFLILQLQFLENHFSNENNNIKVYQKNQSQQTEINVNNLDGILEIASSRSKSSTKSVLQQIQIFHNLLSNLTKSKHQQLFKIINVFFLFFFIFIFITVSFTFKGKNVIFNDCKIKQIQIIYEVAIYSSLINSINNEGIVEISKPYFDINVEDVNLSISYLQYQQILSELIDYSSNNFFRIIQETDFILDLPNNFTMQLFSEFGQGIEYNKVENVLTFRQILSSNIQNYKSLRKKQDLSTIVLNYFNYLEQLKVSTQTCLDDSKIEINQSILFAYKILIFMYVLLILIYLTQIYIVNRMIKRRKFILKLFIRTDYKEALLENEKFQILTAWFNQTKKGWNQKSMSILLKQLNLNVKTLKDDDEILNGLTSSDRRLNEKGEKLLENSEKLKMHFSHRYQNCTGYITISILFLFTLIYILTFHIQITNISDDLLYFSSFSLLLQNYQINYVVQYFRCQYYMNYQFYNYFENKIMVEIYRQNNFTEQNLEDALIQLNKNVFSSILTNFDDAIMDRILKLSEEEQAQFFEGKVCQIDVKICDENSRNVLLKEDLENYYNISLNQIFLQQGQIFYQNNEMYNMEGLIGDYVNNLLISKEYFLNNVWGFDIIINRVSNCIVYFLRRMNNTLEDSESIMFLYALIIGLLYFSLMLMFILLFGWYFSKQDQKQKQCLLQMPFSTILKKNIYSSLKFID
ncbi:unnamed protein product [Paramecium pentaurelia]|uniref:Transmembrane protein n=1 Tax=Paramecium pentaurelia TaxID=43138 RepID=A0A8S1YLD5_9CILI|nr:unnamed protein product [Paramecium pentaurelia]